MPMMTLRPKSLHYLLMIFALLACVFWGCDKHGPGLPDGTAQGGPSAPQSVEIISDDRKLQFRWQPPENEGDSQIIRYEYDFDGRGIWKSMGTRSPYYEKNLINHKTYMVRIRAVNRDGAGVASMGKFATPSPYRTSSKDRSCKGRGAGTSPQNPYIICNYEDLKALHDYYREKGSIFEVHIALGQHIDATPSHREGAPNCVPFSGKNAHEGATCRGWKPLPALRDGSLYGRGYTIFGLYSSRFQEELVGLFSEITHRTQIRNLHLREAHLYSYHRGESYVGAIAAQSYFHAVVEYSSVAGGRIDGPYVVGGLIGEVDQAQIFNSYVKDSTFSKLEIIGEIVGGITGRMIHHSTVHSVASEGTVAGVSEEEDKRIYAGGLVGVVDDSELLFSRSLSSVNSNGAGASIAGRVKDSGELSHVFGSGKVIARGDYKGGVCARTDNSHITKNIYWDQILTQQQSDSCAGTPLSTLKIKVACSNNETSGICALNKSEGFKFSKDEYPEPFQCISRCISRKIPNFGSNVIFSVPGRKL